MIIWVSECTVRWPFEGIKEIKGEEGEEWQKGGRVDDWKRKEDVVHFDGQMSFFSCEILRESSTRCKEHSYDG